MLKAANMDFPIIIKPDVGERGKQVEKIEDEQAFKRYFLNKQSKVICQQYVDYPIELGVLFYQYPTSKKYGITSIVQKSFLQIKGDSFKTIHQLLVAFKLSKLTFIIII
jgi:D-alanine-D-alanine ligase-like ATP-grasp enzyme